MASGGGSQPGVISYPRGHLGTAEIFLVIAPGKWVKACLESTRAQTMLCDTQQHTRFHRPPNAQSTQVEKPGLGRQSN